MRAYKIDVVARQVSEIAIDDASRLKSMQAFVGGYVAQALRLDDDNLIYVNDEGLFEADAAFFAVPGGHQPFAGNGLVVGTDEDGASVSPTIGIEEVRSRIVFLGTIDESGMEPDEWLEDLRTRGLSA